MSSNETVVVDLESVKFNNPLVVGGFVGAAPTGFIAVSYIIENLKLHQVAHIKSTHIPPVAVFIGERLRTPYRIYTNKAADLVVMIGEIPVDNEGLYEISSALMNWLSDKNPREIVILDGTPAPTIVDQHDVFCVGNEDVLNKFKKFGILPAKSALIFGLGGAILNECMSRKMSGLSLITPTSTELPDPGSVLALVEKLNQAFSLNVDPSVLGQSAQDFHAQLNELMDQYKKASATSEKSVTENMYG